MKNHYYLFLKSFFAMIILSIVLSSCVPLRKTVYFQARKAADTASSYVNEVNFDYRVKPGDNLYIRVVTLDQQTTTLLNPLFMGGGQAATNDAGVYLQSYTVSEAGYLDFPMIGEIFVRNMNVDEIKSLIGEKLKEYLKELVVVVKLVNYNITVIGEVKRPGLYKIYQSSVSIFDAIAYAGDMTDFANAQKVAVVRQTKTGSRVEVFDMTKRRILASDYYYLRPNDIVYVRPVRGKQFTFAQFPYGIIFGFISTTILLLSYLNLK